MTALIRKIAFFFGLPFGVAGRIIRLVWATHGTDRVVSLADEEEQIDLSGRGGRLGRSRTGMDERLRGAFRCRCCGCVPAFVHIDSDGDLFKSVHFRLDLFEGTDCLHISCASLHHYLSMLSMPTAWWLTRYPQLSRKNFFNRSWAGASR